MKRTLGSLLFALLVVTAVGAASSCGGDDGTGVDLGCKTDDDCPDPEMKCVTAAGVCVGFETPLTAIDAGRLPRDARP